MHDFGPVGENVVGYSPTLGYLGAPGFDGGLTPLAKGVEDWSVLFGESVTHPLKPLEGVGGGPVIARGGSLGVSDAGVVGP